MGFRFHRRINILPGVTINLSKGGASCSLGPRGAKLTIGPKGVRKTVGIPGTGLSYTSYSSFRKKRSETVAPEPPSSPSPSPAEEKAGDLERLDLGFFRELFLSGPEKQFINGLKALLTGDQELAFEHLSSADTLADAAFTAGFTALNLGDFAGARAAFNACEAVSEDLGKLYAKYELELTLSLRICELIEVEARPDLLSLRLGEVEVLQQLKEYADACNLLIDLCRREPENPAVRLSLAELVLECSPFDQAWLHTLIKLTAGECGSGPIDRALKFYRAAAFENLGMNEAALELLNRALSEPAESGDELTLALRFRRGEILAASGRREEARRDFELICLEDPDYPGLAGYLKT